MRLPIAAALAALSCAAPAAAQTMECQRIAGVSAPGIVEALGYQVHAEGGRIARIVLRLPNGQASTTTLSPVRDEAGRSMRLVTFPVQGGGVSAVFNMATVEQAGTVLIETWIRESTAPAETPPRHNWYRLRCTGSAGGK